MSEIFDNYSQLITEKQQREDVISAQSALVRMTKCLNLELGKIAVIKTGGSFDTISADVKAFFLQWESAFKDLQTILNANATVQEFIVGGEIP